ncbi:hypothetical protein GCM10022419_098270 [Nonomuraea rosea]|uniref:Uncharacterized protein n=1 Tax=Nonomuraea rosea TaxID=638574 RepID=A0ABP6Z5X5_9ACTN
MPGLAAKDCVDIQVKASATAVLMTAAERWAAETGWQPAPSRIA